MEFLILKTILKFFMIKNKMGFEISSIIADLKKINLI